MPIYEYSCQGCHAVFEKLIVRGGDEESATCPSCGGRSLERLMSRPASSRSSTGESSSRTPPRRPCGPVG